MDFLFPFALAEDAAPASPVASWFATAFKKFAEFPVWGWAIVAVLLIGGILLFKMSKGQKKTVWSTNMIALGAICMALSIVLSQIRIFKMPQGGSITPASMLPLIIFAYAYGAGPGVTLGVIFGILKCILNPEVYSIPQFLLDYPVAFGVIGLAGLFSAMKNDIVGLSAGTVLVCFARFVAAVISGAVFFGEWAPEGMSPLVYSLGYNGSYMLPECIITVVVAILIGPRLIREFRKVK